MYHVVASTTFGWVNWGVLIAYLLSVTGFGLWCAHRESGTDQYFLASRKIPGWAAGLSIYGTQLSALTFMAIPAVAYAENWVRIVVSLSCLLVLPIVIRYYIPLFRQQQSASVYDYLERRFSVSVRLFASITWILLQLGRMGIVVYLPASALSVSTGIDVFVCAVAIGLFATIYTTVGGIAADIWTDVVQVIVLITGAVLCLVIILVRVGGVTEFVTVAAADGKFQLFQAGWAPSEMVVWVMIVGGFFTNLVPYTTDQAIVQRYLTTPDTRQANRSLWLNWLMMVPTAVLFYALGTALHVYYSVQSGIAQPVAADQVVPWFISNELPIGVAGLLVAAIFSAAMSSLDSSMNSVATVIVSDFYRRVLPNLDDARYLRFARIVTLLLGCAGTSVAIAMAVSDVRLFVDLFNQMVGLFGGSLAGVYFLAVFTKRTEGTGALIGALCGVAATLVAAFCTEINLYLYAAVGTCTAAIVGYTVSRCLPGEDQQLSDLTVHSMDRSQLKTT